MSGSMIGLDHWPFKVVNAAGPRVRAILRRGRPAILAPASRKELVDRPLIRYRGPWETK